MFYKTQCEAVKVYQRDFLSGIFKSYFSLIREASGFYDFRDSKEKTRLMFYSDLIEKYRYPAERIEFDVAASRGFFDYLADIAVFKDYERKIPYIAVDCCRDGISDADFEASVKSAVVKAEALGADYAVCAGKDKKRIIKISRAKGEINQEIIFDLPAFNF